MHFKILADENVDFRIVRKLTEAGFEIISVLKCCSGISDKEVLKLAKKHNALLLTEDSDFGEWIFSHKEKTTGVIFLRYKPFEYENISNLLIKIIKKYDIKLYDKFTTITTKKIRIREIT